MVRKLCRLIVPFFCLLALAPGLHAETFPCPAGDVPCLIAAITASNATPDADMITLSAGTYLLTRPHNSADPLGQNGNGLPRVTGPLTIEGAGAGVTLLARDRQAPLLRVLDVAQTGTLTVTGLTLMHGRLDLDRHEGGCLRNAGTLTLREVVVRQCTAAMGGGISNRGDLLLARTVVMHNYAERVGGGIGSGAQLRVEQGSWIGDNVAGHGGGIGGRGTMHISHSVIDGNRTFRSGGGGIENVLRVGGIPNIVSIHQSLLSKNTSVDSGGGLSLYDADALVTQSTFWENTTTRQGGALAVLKGQVHLQDVAALMNRAEDPSDIIGEGGGVFVGDQGRLILERIWLLRNVAAQAADCRVLASGQVELRDWTVIGDPLRFHDPATPPCVPD